MKQSGHIYREGRFWYVRYRETVDGIRKQPRKRICPVEPHQERLKNAPPEVVKAADLLLEPLNRQADMGTGLGMTIDQFCERVFWPFMDAERRNVTAYNYKGVYKNHVEPHVGDKRLWEFRTVHASNMLAETHRLHPKLTKSTLYMHKRVLQSIFKHAIGQGYVEGPNPVRECIVPSSQAKGRPKKAYDLATILRILNVVSGQSKAAAAIAGFAALSRSEIMGLQWTDYNGVTLCVKRRVWENKVDPTKTVAREAPVPVIETLQEILDEYRASLGDPREGWMFATRNNTPKGLDDLYLWQMKKRLEVENIPWYGWHAFRRGVATNLKSLGVEDKVIQGILRHANPETTRGIYMKNNEVPVELKAGLDKLQDAIKNVQ